MKKTMYRLKQNVTIHDLRMFDIPGDAASWFILETRNAVLGKNEYPILRPSPFSPDEEIYEFVYPYGDGETVTPVWLLIQRRHLEEIPSTEEEDVHDASAWM